MYNIMYNLEIKKNDSENIYTLNFNYDEKVTKGSGGTLNGRFIITLNYFYLIFSLSDIVNRDLKGKCLEILKGFIQQNKDQEDIKIGKLFIEALNIFNTNEGSKFTKLNLPKYRTYLEEKERIRLDIVGKTKQLIQQIETNNQLITTRTKELETGLSN